MAASVPTSKNLRRQEMLEGRPNQILSVSINVVQDDDCACPGSSSKKSDVKVLLDIRRSQGGKSQNSSHWLMTVAQSYGIAVPEQLVPQVEP